MTDDHDRDPAPPPTLHGLTLDQLEAVRGYIDTCQAVGRLGGQLDELDTLEGAAIRGMAVRRARAMHASALEAASAQTPYGDGARFALSATREQWERLGERLAGVRMGPAGSAAAPTRCQACASAINQVDRTGQAHTCGWCGQKWEVGR